jgi:hypothetical protein
MRSPLRYRSKSSTVTGTGSILCPSQVGEERALDNVTGLAGLQHQGLESEYIGESKATELRG